MIVRLDASEPEPTSATSITPPPPTRPEHRRRALLRSAEPYLFLLPAVCVFGLLVIYPIATTVRLSLRDASLFDAGRGSEFIGLDNYTSLLADDGFWETMAITARYTAFSVIGAFLVGLGLALLMNTNFRLRGITRTAIFSPWVLPQVVGAFIWILIFNPQYGVLNNGLARIGLGPVEWLTNQDNALISVSIVTIWRFFPIAMLMLLAALQSVDTALYEAAGIDGAGPVRRFWHVTLPSIRPVASLLFLLLTVWVFRHFGTIYAMTKGGPAGGTSTLTIEIYLQAFSSYDLGRASALGIISLVISIIFSVLFMYVTVHRPNRKGS